MRERQIPTDRLANAPDLYDLIATIKVEMIALVTLIEQAQRDEVGEPNLTPIQTQQTQLEVLFKSLKEQRHTLHQTNSPTQLRMFKKLRQSGQPANHIEESTNLETEMLQLKNSFDEIKKTIQNKFGTQIARLERSDQPSCCSIS